jgi:hypothetical protein
MAQIRIDDNLSFVRMMGILSTQAEEGELKSKADKRAQRIDCTSNIESANKNSSEQTASKAAMLSLSSFLILGGSLASFFIPNETAQKAVQSLTNTFGPQITNSLSTSYDGNISTWSNRAQQFVRKDNNLTNASQQDSIDQKMQGLFDAAMRAALSVGQR